MEGEERKVKKNWSKDETMAFLKFYKIREAEFHHSRRKKFAYANVLEDMISGGYEPSTKAAHLEVKMAALLRAYKASKDRSRRTAAAPCVAPFLKQMEEIYGSKSKNLNTQTISCGAIDFVEVDVKKEVPFESLEFSYTISQPELEDETEPSIKNESSTMDHLNFVSPANIITSSPAGYLSTSDIPSHIPSAKLNQTDYYEKRLRHLDRSDRQRSKRWEQYLKIQAEKADRHREKMNKLDSIINILQKRQS